MPPVGSDGGSSSDSRRSGSGEEGGGGRGSRQMAGAFRSLSVVGRRLNRTGRTMSTDCGRWVATENRAAADRKSAGNGQENVYPEKWLRSRTPSEKRSGKQLPELEDEKIAWRNYAALQENKQLVLSL